MWERVSKSFCCPLCKKSLELKILKDENRKPITEALVLAEKRSERLNPQENFIIEGIFTCSTCKTWYPIHHGIPVLLPYDSPLRHDFVQYHNKLLSSIFNEYKSPSIPPPPGESFVMKSFSKEWLEYSYDGTLWTWSYEERKKLLKCELGEVSPNSKPKIIDVGCGIGLTTSFACQNYNAEAFGMDLSLAVLQATEHFSHNPYLHFVQSSVFSTPFLEKSFDFVYSHGVLHHTYSTKTAFLNISKLCKPGGTTYIWVYGLGSIDSTIFRRIAYRLEQLIRPIFSRLPSRLSSLLIGAIVPCYLIANWLIRKKNPHISKYNFQRAMHAVRDRFTPMFAHRHVFSEVSDWFSIAGFDNPLQILDHDVPPSAKPDFMMNIGVRGMRSLKTK